MSKFNFTEIPNPFDGISDEERIKFLQLTGTESGKNFQKTLENLLLKLNEVDPVLLLSSFAYYTLTWDGISPEHERSIKILQNHVEILQAFLLQLPIDRDKFQPVVGSLFEEFAELIQQASTEFVLKRFGQVNNGMLESEVDKLKIIEHMRVHTQFVRNPGYPEQIKNNAISLFLEIDKELLPISGVTIRGLIEMSYHIISHVEKRINQRRNKLKKVFSASSIKQMLKLYGQAFSDTTDGYSQLLVKARQNKWTLDEMRYFILSHSDLFLPEIFEFSIDEVSRLYPHEINTEVLRQILDLWSLSFGELSAVNSEYFFMDNPVWKKPFIKLDNERYFIPIVGLLNSFCIDLMEAVIKQYSLFDHYMVTRGQYLENHVANIFSKKFPKMIIYQNLQWVEDDSIYESDMIILFDKLLLIVESKSTKVSETARRGAEKRLKTNIKDSLEYGAEQATRLIRLLQQSKGSHNFTYPNGQIQTIDSTNILDCIPLVITLEFWGAVSSHIPSLKEAQFFDNKIPSVIAMSITDIQIIFEFIHSEAEFIHYLKWRKYIQDSSTYLGDEIDLFAVYCQDGFSKLADMAIKEQFIHVLGESERFTPYFFREEHKLNVGYPGRRFVKQWKSLLSKLETDRPKGWIEISQVLLDFTFEIQEEIVKNVQKRLYSLRKQKTISLLDNFFLVQRPSKLNLTNIIVAPYKGLDLNSEKHTFVKEISLLKETQSGTTLIIFVNGDYHNLPLQAYLLPEIQAISDSLIDQ